MYEREKLILENALMEATRRNQYRQCQVSTECSDPAVKGHLVPISYMKRLLGFSGQLMVFTKYRFGRLPPQLPMQEGVHYATTGYFTCKRHDDLFQSADGVADVDYMPDRRTLNLICYRNVLHTRWWQELWAQAAETVDDQYNKPIQRGIAPVLRKYSQELVRTQYKLEECVLDTNDHVSTPERCHSIEHLVFVSEGPPVLAAAQFGVSEFDSDTLGQWGLTLIPGTTSNAICLHYAKEAAIRAIDMALPSISKGHSTLSGREISRALLKFCSNIVFSKASWSKLTQKEQETVEQAMAPWKPNPEFDIDLFKGSPWKIL